MFFVTNKMQTMDTYRTIIALYEWIFPRQTDFALCKCMGLLFGSCVSSIKNQSLAMDGCCFD